MRVFVAGATGVIGRVLVSALTERGHEVVGLTRSEEGRSAIASRGGQPTVGDLLDPRGLRGAMEGCDAAVRVATAVPTTDRPSAEDWEQNDRLRREGTENLLSAARDCGVEYYLQESVVWVARQPDGSAFDEDSEPHPDRTTESALDAERIAREQGAQAGIDVGTLRLGWLYGADTEQTRDIARELLDGRMPVVGRGVLGRGDAELSLLHADDAGRAFAAALEARVSGTYHVVDDRPVTAARFLRALADRLDAPDPRRVPWWLARPLAGRDAVRFLTSPSPTTSERFRRATDWEPQYPTYEEGLDRTVARLRADGTIDPGSERGRAEA